jgi:hypothetical protein
MLLLLRSIRDGGRAQVRRLRFLGRGHVRVGIFRWVAPPCDQPLQLREQCKIDLFVLFAGAHDYDATPAPVGEQWCGI